MKSNSKVSKAAETNVHNLKIIFNTSMLKVCLTKLILPKYDLKNSIFVYYNIKSLIIISGLNVSKVFIFSVRCIVNKIYIILLNIQNPRSHSNACTYLRKLILQNYDLKKTIFVYYNI